MANINSNYPENFFRGISTEDAIEDSYGEPMLLYSAFQFTNKHGRTDNFHEASITWEDDENAYTVIMNQKKIKGECEDYQFKVGVARISMDKMKRQLEPFIIKGELSYERDKTDDNDYHGNLLLAESLSQKRQLCTHVKTLLCQCVIDIHRRDN
ncbi:hypothetical protein [Synergistes jonesii]|uniref:hypothetical protein n=1 Tax=Synergistes jonesii TaxID=2754 RepID=UPI0033227F3E